MTEQTVNETPETFVVVDLPSEKKFSFNLKKIAIVAAVTTAVAVGLYLKFKSNDDSVEDDTTTFDIVTPA